MRTERHENRTHAVAHARSAIVACVASLTLLLALSPSASALPEAQQFYGVNVAAAYIESESDWDAIKDSGIKLVHMEVNWNRVSHKGWSAYNKAFELAAKRGITILPLILGKQEPHYPAETKEEAIEEQQYPTQLEYGEPGSPWEDWIYEVVQHYGNGGSFWQEFTKNNPTLAPLPVTTWEVWNEPNFNVHNPGGLKVQPENYAKFLKRTASAIREAQKPYGTEVLFAGLFSAASNCKGGKCEKGSEYLTMNVNDFLEQADNVSELEPAFDGLSLHPYSFASGLSGVETNVNFAREKLTKWFSAGKELWVTELGWTIEGDEAHPSVSPEAQAELLSASFKWIKQVSAAKNIPQLSWFDYRDGTVAGWDQHVGLRNSAGISRPAWCTYIDIIQVHFCNPYPFSWPNELNYNEKVVDKTNLGGEKIGGPSISSWEDNRFDVFARGSNNALWHKWYSAETKEWSAWESLFGTLTSGPDAVSWGKNRIDVMAQKDSSHLYHYYWNGSSWNSEVIEGSILGDPTVSSWESGRFDLFVRGTNKQLWHRAFTGGSWTAWEPLGGISNYESPSPDAVSWGPNRIDVVFLNGSTVEHYYWTGSSWGSDKLSGLTAISDPTITSTSSEHLDVFVKGSSDNGLWRNSFAPATGWSGWSPMYGRPMSGPDAVSSGTNRIDLVVQDYLANGSIMYGWTGE